MTQFYSHCRSVHNKIKNMYKNIPNSFKLENKHIHH